MKGNNYTKPGNPLLVLLQNWYSKLIKIFVVSQYYRGQFSFMLSLIIIVLHNACLITFCCAGSICTTFPFRIWKRLYTCLLVWMVVFFKRKSCQMLSIPNKVYNMQIFGLLVWMVWFSDNWLGLFIQEVSFTCTDSGQMF